MERKIKTIVQFLKRKRDEIGCKKAVIGLSGGIDSSVVAALCVDAFGKKDVIGVTMPIYSNALDESDAANVAAIIGLYDYRRIDLSDAYHRLVDDITVAEPDKESKLALANIKPRLRMITQYFIANNENGFVVGTSNKVEDMIGYATKHGDHAADCWPIGDLLKKEVREAAVYYGLPKSIIEKPPSAGLWKDQTDEEEIGLSYDVLDDVVEDLGNGVSPEKCRHEIEVVGKVVKLIDQSCHKRVPPETCYF